MAWNNFQDKIEWFLQKCKKMIQGQLYSEFLECIVTTGVAKKYQLIEFYKYRKYLKYPQDNDNTFCFSS